MAAALVIIAVIAFIAWALAHRRSACCGAPCEYRFGWNWRDDGWYCTACDNFLG